MHIHLTPRLYPCELSGANVDLVDLQTPELQLDLRGGKDLATRRRYANERYVAGCRNVRKEAVAGIIVETPAHIPEHAVVVRCPVDSDNILPAPTNGRARLPGGRPVGDRIPSVESAFKPIRRTHASSTC